MDNENRDLAVGFVALDVDTGEELVFISNFSGLDMGEVPLQARATNGRVYRLGIIRNFNGLEQIVAERVLAQVARAS